MAVIARLMACDNLFVAAGRQPIEMDQIQETSPASSYFDSSTSKSINYISGLTFELPCAVDFSKSRTCFCYSPPSSFTISFAIFCRRCLRCILSPSIVKQLSPAQVHQIHDSRYHRLPISSIFSFPPTLTDGVRKTPEPSFRK
jgi:hypothetical protein